MGHHTTIFHSILHWDKYLIVSVSMSSLWGKLVPPGVICNDPKSLMLNCENILSSRYYLSPNKKVIIPILQFILTPFVFDINSEHLCSSRELLSFIHFQLLPLAWDITIKFYSGKWDWALIIWIIQPIVFHLYVYYRNTATGVLFLRLTLCLTINSVSNLDSGFSVVKGRELKSTEDRLLIQVSVSSPFYILST